jgi:hypothetical protein
VSAQPPSFDAYAPPLESGQPTLPGMSLTTGIKAICIIAIILGVLGVMSAVSGAVGLVVGSRIQQIFAPAQIPGDQGDIQEFQQEMQARSRDLLRRYLPAHIARIAFHLPIAVGLLAGGIATLAGSLRGRRILRAACGIAIPFELCRAVLDTIVQLENMAIMRPFMERMFDDAVPGGQGPPPEMMSSMFQVAVIAGLGFSLLLVLAKVIFYLIAVLKLRSIPAHSASPFS